MQKLFFLIIFAILSISILEFNQPAFALSKANNLYLYHNFNNTSCPVTNVYPDESTHAGSHVGLGVSVTQTNSGSCFPGIIGNGLKFPVATWGTLGNGSKPLNWLHDGTTPWSFSFWLLNDDSGAFAQNTTVLYTNSNPPTRNTKGISIQEAQGDGATTDFMRVSIGSGTGVVFDKTFLNAVPKTHSNWAFFVITFLPSTKTMQLYVNGTLFGTQSNSTLGGFASGNSLVDPRLPDFNNQAYFGNDEFAFWNTILTPADVTLLYNNTHGYNLLVGNGTTPTLSLNSTSGSSGSHVLLSGIGFTPSINTNIFYDGTGIGSAINNSTGGFSIPLTIPLSFPGSHIINATDTASPHRSSTINYTVTSNITLNPATGPVSTTVSSLGNGFAANSALTIKFDGTTLTTIPASPKTDHLGQFNSTTFVVPSNVTGSHIVRITDASGNFHTAIFSITPSVLITPSTGPVSTTVSSLGNGFAANSALTIKFDGTTLTTIPASPKTDHLGQFNSTSFIIPSTTAGNHILSFTDGSSNSASTTFTVTSSAGFLLYYTAISPSSVTLSWNSPTLLAHETLIGYQINYTTPHGTPKSIITNNTASSITSMNIGGLAANTDYSFRVGVWTNSSTNKNTTNILDLTTLTNSTTPGGIPVVPPTLTPGSLDLNVGTNPTHVGYQFFRQNTNATKIDLYVSYPSSYNTTCNLNYEFANTNHTYYNLSNTPNGTGRVKADFQFFNLGSEIVNTICHDVKTNDTGHYTITNSITTIPLVQQVQNFENGVYGTQGQFGAFDLVELMVIIISMIALNRVNETVGAIIMIFVLAGLAYFHIGSFPVIIFSAIAMVVLLTVSTTKRLAFTP